MKVASWSAWSLAWAGVLGVAMASVAWVGCGPSEPAPTLVVPPGENGPEQPTPEPEQPVTEPEQPVTEPDQPVTEPEQPVTEPEQPMPEPEEPAAGRADPATSPPVSRFAPAADLVNQLDQYIAGLEKCVVSEEEFADTQNKIANDANTLIVIAQALALHDEENDYKGKAGALIAAAQDVLKASTLAEAQKAVEALKTAAAEGGDGNAPTEWEPIASLEHLMKQVPLVNTRLKRTMTGARFESRADDNAGYAAVLAAIAQASMVDTHEATNDDEVQQWYDFCAMMRDAAGAVRAAVRAGDREAADAAMATLAKSCDDCHAVFHVEALDMTDP
jgi:hypothetical protein